jgi:hypothetical protein
MGYGLEGRVSILGRGKIFLSSTTSRQTLGSTELPMKLVPWALSPGEKRQGREVDLSPPSNAEVKNGGAIPPLPYKSSRCGV